MRDKIRNLYKILVGKPTRRHRHWWRTVLIYFREAGFRGEDWIHLAKEWAQ
jgi:hypothetical protein